MTGPAMRAARRPALLALVLFCVLSVAHTWPLATNPARLARVDNGDMLLNAWIMGWVAHQLPRDPLHLFDANIFWPDRLTLAYSEHLLLQSALTLPVQWLGGSPVLAHNLAMLAGFALTGWAFCLLARRWTGSWPAGLVAGSLAAFNTHTLTRLAHVQAQHLEFIALALFALDRLFVDRRVRDAVTLGCAVTLQGLASIYLLVFTGAAMAWSALARLEAWLRPRRLRLAGLLGLSVAVALVTSLPVIWPYYRLRTEMGFQRSPEDARKHSTSWHDFAATGARVHFDTWSAPYFARSQSAAFPGVAALLLTAAALARGRHWRDGRFRMVLAMTLGGALMSFMARWDGYAWLYEHVRMLQGIRAPSRAVVLALVGVALLAGYGVREIETRWGRRRGWGLVAALLVVLVNAEASRAPLDFPTYEGIPRVYDVLRGEKHAVIVELPLWSYRVASANAPYLLNSTRHFRPMLNGYSGIIPPSYHRSVEAVDGFPGPASLAALHALGVTHVVVHVGDFRHGYGAEALGQVQHHPALVPVAEQGDIEIYRLRQ
jgi:hypothetical protein